MCVSEQFDQIHVYLRCGWCFKETDNLHISRCDSAISQTHQIKTVDCSRANSPKSSQNVVLDVLTHTTATHKWVKNTPIICDQT